jgi:hypothetical protein
MHLADVKLGIIVDQTHSKISPSIPLLNDSVLYPHHRNIPNGSVAQRSKAHYHSNRTATSPYKKRAVWQRGKYITSPVPSAKAGAAMLRAATAGARAFLTPAGTWKPSAFMDTAARQQNT